MKKALHKLRDRLLIALLFIGCAPAVIMVLIICATETKHIKHTINTLLITALFWLVLSIYIQAFKCPELSQTQLFFLIPKAFIGHWAKC